MSVPFCHAALVWLAVAANMQPIKNTVDKIFQFFDG
jgi:hypothetical protein